MTLVLPNTMEEMSKLLKEDPAIARTKEFVDWVIAHQDEFEEYFGPSKVLKKEEWQR